jgi:hypothetical protein
MTRVSWGSFDYQSGVDRGVFYPKNSPGEVWDGIAAIEETNEANERVIFLDGYKLGQRKKEVPFSCRLSTYTNPASWYTTIAYQRSVGFGFTYRTMDEIHIVYNASAQPSELMHQYSEPGLYQWSITTRPLALPEGGHASHLIIDTTTAYPEQISDLEDILYGTELTDPRLPTPEEVLEVFEIHSILRVIDNEDGTYTVTGPDEAIVMLDANTFQITWPTAIFTSIGSTTYTIRSL